MKIKGRNTERAERGARSINFYSNLLYKKPGVNEETVIDLITDILHFCDAENIDKKIVLRLSKLNYEAESGKKAL